MSGGGLQKRLIFAVALSLLTSENSLLFSLLSGNLDVETGSIRTASATTHSCAKRDFLLFAEYARFCAGVAKLPCTNRRGVSAIGRPRMLSVARLAPAQATDSRYSLWPHRHNTWIDRRVLRPVGIRNRS